MYLVQYFLSQPPGRYSFAHCCLSWRGGDVSRLELGGTAIGRIRMDHWDEAATSEISVGGAIGLMEG